MSRPLRIVLVVDDDTDLRELFAVYLQRAGFGVLEAANGLEGFELAKTHCPDLIFTDIEMPMMDGIQLIETLRRDPATENIPVVCISGMDRRERPANANCHAVLHKPIDFGLLVEFARGALAATPPVKTASATEHANGDARQPQP
jgi:CheY-like chemotaxis protein